MKILRVRLSSSGGEADGIWLIAVSIACFIRLHLARRSCSSESKPWYSPDSMTGPPELREDLLQVTFLGAVLIAYPMKRTF